MTIEQSKARNRTEIAAPAQEYELHFESVSGNGSTYAFPCDARGHVDMDALSSSALNDYLFVRVFVGRTFSIPCVQRATTHSAYEGADAGLMGAPVYGDVHWTAYARTERLRLDLRSADGRN